jgi:RNA polymerase sigma-70 factor (ECF subfamily)
VEPEAQDIVSEGFVKLWRLHANFKSLDNIRAFLFLTARNASVDHLRLTQRRRSCHQEILHLMGQDDAIENDMIDAAVFDEVSRQIEALPEKCREVFRLLFYHRMSTAETAKELNISARKVQNQKERAIRLLRSALLKKFLLD